MPEQQSLAGQLPAAADQTDEELVGLQVVEGMPAVVAGVVAALDVVARIVAMPVGEHPGPPRRDQAHGVTTFHARCLDHFPDVDEAETLEMLKTYLAGAEAGKEEFCDLERVQVAVVMEELKDDQVALGE